MTKNQTVTSVMRAPAKHAINLIGVSIYMRIIYVDFAPYQIREIASRSPHFNTTILEAVLLKIECFS